jgi:hypothetical protein
MSSRKAHSDVNKGRVNWRVFMLAMSNLPGCELYFTYALVLTALKLSTLFFKIVKDTIVTGFKTNEACLWRKFKS